MCSIRRYEQIKYRHKALNVNAKELVMTKHYSEAMPVAFMQRLKKLISINPQKVAQGAESLKI